MNESILKGILIFGIIQAFFFSLQYSTKNNKTVSDRIIGLWLLILATQILFIVLNLNNQNKTGFLFITNFQLLFTLLHGPFLFLYVKKLVFGERSFTKKDTYHFIPFIIVAGLSLIFYFINIDNEMFIKGIAITGVISGLLYCFITLTLLQKHKGRIKKNFSYTERINLNWLLNLTIGLLTIWVGASVLVILSRFCSINLPLTWFFIIVPVFIFYIGFFAIRQQIIYTAPVTITQNKVSVSTTKMLAKASNSYYKSWHPIDHIEFKWTKGKPMESGSSWYGKEIVRGIVFELKGTVGEVIPNRKIVLKYSFPVSFVAPWFEWSIEPKGSISVFTARSYLRAGVFYLKYFKKEMEPKLEMHYHHVKEEGENLKKILESL